MAGNAIKEQRKDPKKEEKKQPAKAPAKAPAKEPEKKQKVSTPVNIKDAKQAPKGSTIMRDPKTGQLSYTEDWGKADKSKVWDPATKQYLSGFVNEKGEVVDVKKAPSGAIPVWGEATKKKLQSNKDVAQAYAGVNIVRSAQANASNNPDDLVKGSYIALKEGDERTKNLRLQKVKDLGDGTSLYIKGNKQTFGLLGSSKGWAAIGTLIFPGVGTAIGYAAGEAVGKKRRQQIAKDLPGWAYDVIDVGAGAAVSPFLTGSGAEIVGGSTGARKTNPAVDKYGRIVGRTAVDVAGAAVGGPLGAAATDAAFSAVETGARESAFKDVNWNKELMKAGISATAAGLTAGQWGGTSNAAVNAGIRSATASAIRDVGTSLIDKKQMKWDEILVNAGISGVTAGVINYASTRLGATEAPQSAATEGETGVLPESIGTSAETATTANPPSALAGQAGVESAPGTEPSPMGVSGETTGAVETAPRTILPEDNAAAIAKGSSVDAELKASREGLALSKETAQKAAEANAAAGTDWAKYLLYGTAITGAATLGAAALQYKGQTEAVKETTKAQKESERIREESQTEYDRLMEEQFATAATPTPGAVMPSIY